ncbi:MAG: hypothetical protein AAGF31_10075 [Planctomycetota bacterium]
MRFLMAAVAAAFLATSVGCQSMGSRGCGPTCAAPGCGCSDCGPVCGDCCACGDHCGGCGNCVTCDGCGGGGCDKCGGCGILNKLTGGAIGGAGDPSLCPLGPGDSVYDFQPGPPVGQVAYPYYTTKGPRDFLMKNPPSIGPSGAYDCR